MPKKPVRKVVTVEVETMVTNTLLKQQVREQLKEIATLRVIQVGVDAIRTGE